VALACLAGWQSFAQDAPFENADQAGNALREATRALAEAQNVPAYVVFADRTLIEMAEKRPATLDKMAGITGVGAKKLDSYGAAFLEVITGAAETLHPARMRLVGKPEGALFDRLAAAVGNLVSDVLRTASGKVAAGGMIGALGQGVTALVAGREELLTEEPRARSKALRDGFIGIGAPEGLAAKVANLFDFDGAVGLAQAARSSGIEPRLLTHAFTDIGTALGLDWAQGTAAHMSPSDVWERLLVSGLARDFQQMRIEFLRRLMQAKAGPKAGNFDPRGAVAEWAARNHQGVAQFRSMIARAQSRPPVGAAMLAQIASQARNLLER
jgi:NAD-specific glutamate dehydrogenase